MRGNNPAMPAQQLSAPLQQRTPGAELYRTSDGEPDRGVCWAGSLPSTPLQIQQQRELLERILRGLQQL